MATKATFICDCCQREALNNFGWARIEVSGDKKLLVDDETRDLCEICWSPLKTLMQEISSKVRTEGENDPPERRNYRGYRRLPLWGRLGGAGHPRAYERKCNWSNVPEVPQEA